MCDAPLISVSNSSDQEYSELGESSVVVHVGPVPFVLAAQLTGVCKRCRRKMTNLQAQAHQKMVTLAKQPVYALVDMAKPSARSGSNGDPTDTRGTELPVVSKGDEQRYPEWKAKLFAFLRVSTPQVMEWMSWAGRQEISIDEELVREDLQGAN